MQYRTGRGRTEIACEQALHPTPQHGGRGKGSGAGCGITPLGRARSGGLPAQRTRERWTHPRMPLVVTL